MGALLNPARPAKKDGGQRSRGEKDVAWPPLCWERRRAQEEQRCLWVLSTWIWWARLCFTISQQTVQRLSDEMGSIWAYLHSRWTALSHFEMLRPDGVLCSTAPPFFFPHLLQTNQYPHSLAFHRKDYREMAIKGLASITSTISKPLKDSGKSWVRIWDPVPHHTARVVRGPQDRADF